MAQTQKVRGTATSVGRTSDSIFVFYHETRVAKVARQDGKADAKSSYVTLDNGGYRTATTKLRMNQFASEYCSGAFSVYQKRHEWFLIIKGVDRHIPFECNRVSFYIPSSDVRY